MITFVYLYVLLLSLIMISVIDAFLKHISLWKALWGNVSKMPFFQAGMIFAGFFGILICIIEDIQRQRKKKTSQTNSKSKESNQQ